MKRHLITVLLALALAQPAAAQPPDGCREWRELGPPERPLKSVPPVLVFQRGYGDEGPLVVVGVEARPGAVSWSALELVEGDWYLTWADWEADCGELAAPITWAFLQASGTPAEFDAAWRQVFGAEGPYLLEFFFLRLMAEDEGPPPPALLWSEARSVAPPPPSLCPER